MAAIKRCLIKKEYISPKYDRGETMEPSLNDISDYKKPLGKKKRDMIIGAFVIAALVGTVIMLLTVSIV